MIEFGASIKLDSASATEQMRKFATQATSASKALKQFQKETKATAQGGGANVFRSYINSSQKANQQILKSITLIHDQRKAFSKLNDEEKQHIATADRLNQKYDESARVERKLVNIRKELRIVTASGLKTQKQADIIFNREAESLKRSTRAYKENAIAKRKVIEIEKRNTRALHEARMAHDKKYAIQQKVAVVDKQLTLLLKNKIISQKQYNRLLTETRIKTKLLVNENHKLISTQQRMIKLARAVSVASRILLGIYAAVRAVRMFVDFEKTAEAVKLLDQKLTFLTGDSGAYKKLFAMTQEVGVKMESANKIITRFAVVTNRAFSIETMAEWSGTLIKSARATGTSTQEMTGALIQITQAMSAGRLMGDEYRSVTENLPLLTVALRDIFGRSTSSLKELSSQGLITNEVMIEAFGRTKELLQGFPDSTDTIEAAMGRMSSSWDDLIAHISNTNWAKNVANNLSNIFIGIKELSVGDELLVAETALRKLNKEIFKTESLLRSNKKDSSNGFFKSMVIEDAEKSLILLNKQYAETKENILVIKGISKGQLAEKAADKLLQDIRKQNEEYKQQQITLQFIDKLNRGKSIFTIEQNALLERNILLQKQDLFNRGEAGGINPEQFFDLADTIDSNKQTAIDKVIQKQIDSELRLKGFSTKNNIEKIEEELKASGKIVAIRKKLIKDIKTVESAAEARKLGLRKGQNKDQLDDTTSEKSKRLIDSLKAKELKDISDHINLITSGINSVGAAAEANTAKLNGDITAALGFDKLSILAKYEKKLEALNVKIKQLGDSNVFLKNTGKELNEYRKEQIELLTKEKDALIFKRDEDFDSKLEGKFDAGAAAVRVYRDEVIALTAAKDRLNLSEFEHNRQLLLLTHNMENQVNQSKALRGELTGFEQTMLGMNKGMNDFADSAKTAFETVAESTDRMLEGMVDAILIGGQAGQDSFRKMTESILKDLERMIIKALLLKAINATLGLFGGNASGISGVFAGSQQDSMLAAQNSGFAKGGVQSGAGISAYSNTVVNKPTIFPFAKGTGLMGEDGEEAIMPLTRLPNGNLGVGTVNGSGRSGDNNVTISVRIDNDGKAEQKTESSENDGFDLGNVLAGAVNEQLIKEMRPGGILNRRGR